MLVFFCRVQDPDTLRRKITHKDRVMGLQDFACPASAEHVRKGRKDALHAKIDQIRR